ncbi:MAG: hypothetical protein EPO32_11750 [Anaerolineae bacterium]|nr:MAG: hypothetical protein EPO32_11750 [Anaerolineae bacterium]
MNRAERRWLLVFTLIVFLVTLIPYGLGFANQDENRVFTGFFIGVEDGNSYLAKMMRGWMGDWLFRSPYSSADQAGLPALLPYVWLGKLTTPTNQHTQFLILFQALRLVGIGIAVWGTYRFASVFFKELYLRHWVVGLSLLGGGLGWLLALIGQGDLLGSLPLDYISPEAFGFLSVYSLPHLAAARGLLLFGLAAYLRTPQESGSLDRDGLRAGLGWLALSLLQPLTVVVGGLVVALHLCVTGVLAWRGVEGFGWPRWRGALRCALWLGLPPLPVMLWTVLAFARDPYAQAWTAQNILTTPHPLHYLLGFAILLPFVALGLRPLWSADRWRAALVFGWLAVVPLLIYIPIPVQRRLAEGVFAVLAVAALAAFQARPSWKPALLSPAFLTTLFLLLGGTFTTSGPSGTPVFRSAAEVRAFEAFRDFIPPDSVVLASYDTSNALPAWLPVRVVTGHGPESLGGREFRNVAERLMLGRMDPDDIEPFLIEQHIDYIFWKPLATPTGAWDPADASYLQSVATSGKYVLYAVNP